MIFMQMLNAIKYFKHLILLMFKKNLKNTFLFKSQEYSSIKVLALTRSLFYTNIDDLNKELNRSCCLEKKLDRQQIERNYFGDENDNEMLLCDSQNNYDTNFGKNFFSGIVLDCTRCNFIDESGAKCLKEIVDKYAKENVKLVLSNCNGKKLF